MTTLTLPRPRASRLTHALRELHDVQPALVVFALVMLAAMLPALVALGLDERTLRGANVWAKPMKFMASVAVYALTTAWFVSLLPAARRHAAPVRWAVWTLIVTGGVEIAYITLQAALGQASHYNTTDALHGSLYTLMGVAAGVLTATQLVFAHELWRHGRTDRPRLLVVGASVGALLTFVLGAGAGGLLGGLQPPAGWGLPLVGWHAAAGGGAARGLARAPRRRRAGRGGARLCAAVGGGDGARAARRHGGVVHAASLIRRALEARMAALHRQSRSTTRYIRCAAISRSATYDTRSASPLGTRCVHSKAPPA